MRYYYISEQILLALFITKYDYFNDKKLESVILFNN